jgi:hypothetical protein
MKKLKTLLFCSFILASMQLKAQVNIGIDTVYNFLTQVNNYQTVGYTVHIRNYGPDTLFNGNLTLYTAVDTGNALNTIKTDTSLSGVQVFLPNTTLTIQDSISFAGGGGNTFRLNGGNVIVIWPQAIGANLIQSYTNTVFISNNQGIGEIRIEKNSIIGWPNPTKEKVFLTISNPKITIERVRMFDSKGAEVVYEEHSKIMDIKQLPSGVYILSATLSNGEVKTIKVIKE